MLSIEQLTIVAYVTDGDILCRKCGEKQGLPTKDALCAYSAGEFADNDGLYCGDCSKEIVEPYTWTCPDCGADYVGSDAVTSESSYDDGGGCGAVDCTGDEDDD